MIEQSSRSLKIVLGVLFVILLAGLAFLSLSQKATQKETPAVVAPTPTTPVTPTPPTKEAPLVTTPDSAPIPFSNISKEEYEIEFKAIRDKAEAGTISSTEAGVQFEALRVKADIPKPPLE